MNYNSYYYTATTTMDIPLLLQTPSERKGRRDTRQGASASRNVGASARTAAQELRHRHSQPAEFRASR